MSTMLLRLAFEKKKSFPRQPVSSFNSVNVRNYLFFNFIKVLCYRSLYPQRTKNTEDLQCSTAQMHRTQNSEDSKEAPNWLSEKSIHDITDFNYPSNSRQCTCKKLEATILFVDFSKAFDSIHSGNMEQMLLTYNLTKETSAAITMLYKTRKQKSGHWMDTQATLTL